MTDEKIRIDQDSITFRELATIEDELGESLTALFEKSQARATAALVWITKRRTDPTFTFDAALDLGPSVLDQTTLEPDLARGGASGVTPPLSPVPGISTRTA